MSDAEQPPGAEQPPRAEGARAVKLLERLTLDPLTQETKPRQHARSMAEAVVDVVAPDGTQIDRGRMTRAEKQAISEASLKTPKPSWLKIKLPGGGRFQETARVVREQGLTTICEEGHCPNIGECWGKGTATFQILGDMCTRACRYCAVATGIPGTPPDPLEPGKLAHAVEQMGIRHAVVTSVDRDDLPDRGAGHFAATIHAIHRRVPGTSVEVLTPDFMGVEEQGLQTVIAAKPEVFSHNVETVSRLYRRVRPKGNYERALWVLRRAKEISLEQGNESPILTKTALITGMGETNEELREVLRDIRAANVDVVAIGQYLRPTRKHLPVDRYVTPDEFDELHEYGMSLGFGSVFSGPLVRSSYKAEEQREAALHPTLHTKLTSGPPPVTAETLEQIGSVPDWKLESDDD